MARVRSPADPSEAPGAPGPARRHIRIGPRFGAALGAAASFAPDLMSCAPMAPERYRAWAQEQFNLISSRAHLRALRGSGALVAVLGGIAFGVAFALFNGPSTPVRDWVLPSAYAGSIAAVAVWWALAVSRSPESGQVAQPPGAMRLDGRDPRAKDLVELRAHVEELEAVAETVAFYGVEYDAGVRPKGVSGFPELRTRVEQEVKRTQALCDAFEAYFEEAPPIGSAPRGSGRPDAFSAFSAEFQSKIAELSRSLVEVERAMKEVR